MKEEQTIRGDKFNIEADLLRLDFQNGRDEWYNSLENERGVYCYVDKHDNPLYIGRSENLGRRLKDHGYAKQLEETIPECQSVLVYLTDDGIKIEKEMINRHRPPYNKAGITLELEKMAFWLDKDIKEKLKILAIKEKRTASAILREVLGKYLK